MAATNSYLLEQRCLQQLLGQQSLCVGVLARSGQTIDSVSCLYPTFLPARALAGGGQRPIHGLGPACEAAINQSEQTNGFPWARQTRSEELRRAATIGSLKHCTP